MIEDTLKSQESSLWDFLSYPLIHSGSLDI